MSLPADRSANLLLWAAMWVALFGWQTLTTRRPDVPSVGAVAQLLRRWWPTRWLVVVGWVWLGWHLFVRTTF